MPAEPTVRRPTTGRPRTRTERSTSRGITPSPSVTIVVPTLNEADNIVAMLDQVDRAMTADLPEQHYEVVVVDDDSADGTWRLAQDRAAADHRVRVIRRVGRRGLSSAVLAGMAVARGDVLVVIDADLQHDERCIPALVRAVSGGADVALGSREVDGGGYGTFGRRRLAISRVGAVLARSAIGVDVTDPMSGFFAVSRDRYEAVSGGLNPRGFKIMLEFLARGPEPAVAEVGYLFRQRTEGSTKFDVSVIVAFVVSVIELSVARRLGRRRSRASSSQPTPTQPTSPASAAEEAARPTGR